MFFNAPLLFSRWLLRTFAVAMTTLTLTPDTLLAPAYAATIGFFDGVHLGHCHLIEQLRTHAARRGMRTMVITFDRHPLQVLHGGTPHQLLLSSFQEKEALLRLTGIDTLVVLPFSQQMASLPARDFMQQVLSLQLGVKLLLTGYDNHFGRRDPQREEGFSDYVSYGREVGIEVVCGEPLTVDGHVVSSSFVRQQLLDGHVEQAASCLGRPYSIDGIVEHGEQQGRLMGYPTANLRLSVADRIVPAVGVYAVRATVDDNDHTPLTGMTNIGTRPTFGGDHAQTIETHLFDYSADLYGHRLRLSFVARLRSEQTFSSAAALARQMGLDAAEARRILK